MKVKIKQHVLLGIVEGAKKLLINTINEVIGAFEQKDWFVGSKKTYESTDENYPVIESKIADYKPKLKVESLLTKFGSSLKDYFDGILTVEKTNSQGKTANLIIDGKDFGKITLIEAMRLRSSIKESVWTKIAHYIPVLDGNKIWNKADDGLYYTAIKSGKERTTYTDYKSVLDQNLVGKELPASYQTKLVEVKRTIEIGEWTEQSISSAYTFEQYNEIKNRQDKLMAALNEVIAQLNTEEIIETEVNTKSLTDYLTGF